MNKKLVTIGVVFLSTSLFGQNGTVTTSASKFRPGIKLGLAFSKVDIKSPGTSGGEAPAVDMRKGLVIGGYYRIRLHKSFAVQPELQLIFKGWRDKAYSSNIAVTYIEIPLNLLFTSYGTRGSTFYLGGGPAPAINLNDNSYFGLVILPKQFDFGINMLTGFETPMGFSFNIHYTHSLLNLNEYDTGPEMRTRCFGLTVGYTF